MKSSLSSQSSIPVMAAQPPGRRRGDAKHSSGERPKALPLDGLSVLVVEDVVDALELMSELFERAGAEVHGATDGAQALAQVDAGLIPDLVVSDIAMPGMDGYQLIRELRSRPLAHQPPAVAVTAFTRRHDRLQALRAGFQAHVGKPVDTEELVAILAALSQVCRSNES